jgi:hypothetical protein
MSHEFVRVQRTLLGPIKQCKTKNDRHDDAQNECDESEAAWSPSRSNLLMQRVDLLIDDFELPRADI